MPPVILDVVVPDGTYAGGKVTFKDSHGHMLEATVPDGLMHGDTFQVEIDETDGSVQPLAALNAFVQRRAESGGNTRTMECPFLL